VADAQKIAATLKPLLGLALREKLRRCGFFREDGERWPKRVAKVVPGKPCLTSFFVYFTTFTAFFGRGRREYSEFFFVIFSGSEILEG